MLETRAILWTVPQTTQTVDEKFIDMVSDSTSQLSFKRLPVSGFSVTSKEIIIVI